MPREPALLTSEATTNPPAADRCPAKRRRHPRTSGDGVWAIPSRRDGQTQVENLCYGGSTEASQIRVDRSCICRAEQDWQDARSERPAMGHGQP